LRSLQPLQGERIAVGTGLYRHPDFEVVHVALPVAQATATQHVHKSDLMHSWGPSQTFLSLQTVGHWEKSISCKHTLCPALPP